MSVVNRQIFVFGSNREGRHGKGAALCARNEHGAVWGQAEGSEYWRQVKAGLKPWPKMIGFRGRKAKGAK